MRKFLALAFVPLLFMVGCGDPAPVETVSAEQRYLDNLKNASPETESVPDDKLVDTGQAACGALDRGVTLEEIFIKIYTSGLDPELTGAIVGAAVKDLCPEHRDDVEEYLRSLNDRA